jgi:hypothetical protein
VSEWWTYRLSDFLLFSAPTYHRLFELHNAAWWPAQLLALALGLGLAGLAWRAWRAGPAHAGRDARLALALLGAVWGAVAWAFLLQRYAAINWAAPWMAAAFALQGLALLGAAALAGRWRLRWAQQGPRGLGLGLLLFALLVQPLLGPLLGRPWAQAEVFGLAPDPTVLATLGVLLLLRREGGADITAWLWTVPLLWCAISGATLWALQSPEAGLMPAAGALAFAVRLVHGRGRGQPRV